MTENTLMKDGLDKRAVVRIASGLIATYPSFNAKGFSKLVLESLHDLELKERVDLIIEALNKFLPKKFSETAKILKALPKHWDSGDENDPLSGFAIWPVTDYVGVYGIHAPSASLDVLVKLTPLFSAEFAIRPFIEIHPKTTFTYLNSWVEHRDEHVRRLVSEGTRPRLPWGKRLNGFIEDPSPIFPLLEKLKHDPSLYVRRSVANNLNDISKDHPERVITFLTAWSKDRNEHIDWIIKHALRTLIKSGHPKVFPLLGFDVNPTFSVKQLSLQQKKIRVGDLLEFNLDLVSKKQQKFVLDYAIHFVKASDKTSKKVFKWKNISMRKQEKLALKKSHSFKEISTRKYYVGKHVIAIHINGVVIAELPFLLTEA